MAENKAEQPERQDDFYVGYLPQAPASIARFVRFAVVGILVITAVVAVLLASAQKNQGPGTFEFGIVHAYQGVVFEKPYPTLEVESSDHPEVAAGQRHYLVLEFKFGADGEVEGLDGRRVKLAGTLIYREGERMIEVVPGSVEELEGGDEEVAEVSLGQMSLVGEIVDSKCYLGVMKPSTEKPHRACAVRCISGGIPPIFLVREAEGPAAHLLLVGSDGRQLNDEVLDHVAEPLEITGEVRRAGDLYTLRTEPSEFVRLP